MKVETTSVKPKKKHKSNNDKANFKMTGPTLPVYINIGCKWLKLINQKIQISRMDRNTGPIYLLPIRNISHHQREGETES